MKRTSLARVAATLFVITLFAFVLADVVNSFIAQALEPPSVASTQLVVQETLQTSINIDVVAQTILDGNLFAKPEQLELAADGSVAQSLSGYEVLASGELITPDGPFGLRLMGTVVGSPQLTYAVIDVEDEGQGLYHLQDMILGVAKVVNIARNKVTVNVGGKPALLRTEFEPIQPVPPLDLQASKGSLTAARVSKPIGKAVRKKSRKKSKQRLTLDRKEVEAAFANLPRLLTQAKVVPHYSSGKMSGFQVVAVKSDSLFARIGLQPQDVLKRLNGMEIKDPSRFLSAFQQVKEEDTITLDLVREGHPSTFVYDIR